MNENENEVVRQCQAYAMGYHDGITYGNEETRDIIADVYRHYYKIGYERGVSDYCDEAHKDDIEN
jgi:hypothetical protein